MNRYLIFSEFWWLYTLVDMDVLRKSPSSYLRFAFIGIFNFQISLLGAIAIYLAARFYQLNTLVSILCGVFFFIFILGVINSCLSGKAIIHRGSLRMILTGRFSKNYYKGTLTLIVLVSIAFLIIILSVTLWISLFGKEIQMVINPFALFVSGVLFTKKSYLLLLIFVLPNISMPFILGLVLTGSYEKNLEIKLTQRFLKKWEMNKELENLDSIVVSSLNSISEELDKKINSGLYISYIKLTNIRCFSLLEQSFDNEDGPTYWTIFLGDNSTGKSTLLRSLAIGICDQSSATALIKESGRFLKHGESNGEIKIRLKDYTTNEEFEIITEIFEEYGSQKEKIKQYTNTLEGSFPWKRIFASAYGTQRYLTGKEVQGYDIFTALKPLFDNSLTLQKPETILLRQKVKGQQESDIEKTLLEILMTNPDEFNIQNTRDGMKVNDIEFKLISDGYKSTIVWVMDLLSWLMNAEKFNGKDSTGIVFIDELEQHLHPKWQKSIVSRLKSQFPNIQFFATTHSPLITSAVGSVDTDLDTDKVIHLKKTGDGFIKYKKIESLKGLDIDQMLAHEAFDHQMNEDDPEMANLLWNATVLASKGKERTSEEDKEYSNLREKIKKITFSEHKTEIERDIEGEEYKRMLQKMKDLEN